MSNQLEESVLNDYLRKVEQYLTSLPPVVREGEMKEIQNHLQQAYNDLIAQGYASGEATSIALNRFGSPAHIGRQLRDVWECNRSAFAVFMAAMMGNWLLYALSIWTFVRTFSQGFSGPLMPAVVPLFWGPGLALLMLLPFLLNFALGQWGGRHTTLAVTIIYIPLLLIGLPLATYLFSLGFVTIPLPAATPVVLLIMSAVAGAWSGTAWQKKRRFAVLATNSAGTSDTALDQASFNKAAALLLRPRPIAHRLVVALAWLAALSLTGIGVLAGVKQQANQVLRPSSPEAAVRVLLSDPGYNTGEMLPSTNVVVRRLPATNAAERNGTEAHIAYSATMHATPQFRQRMTAWMQKELQAEREGRYHSWPARDARITLSNLKPEGYRTHGVLHVTKTPDGWKVNTSGDTANQPWAWLYVIGYRSTK